MVKSGRVAEINKIICNHLLRELTIGLPSVGSLSVCRVEARLVSPKRLNPPFKRVVFSSKQTGDSLVDIISAMTGCNESSAHEIYAGWLDEVRNGDSIEIEGVGRLCNGEFYADDEFDKLLNPCSRDVIRLTPHSGVLKVVVWSMLLSAMVVGGAYVGYIYFPRAENEIAIEVAAPVLPVETVVKENVVVADTLDVPEVVVPVKDDLQVVGQMISNRNYVVLGVFTTETNALRSAEDAKSKEPSLECRVYNYGTKFMVAMFESDQPSDCEDFMRNNRNRFDDLWIYVAK